MRGLLSGLLRTPASHISGNITDLSIAVSVAGNLKNYGYIVRIVERQFPGMINIQGNVPGAERAGAERKSMKYRKAMNYCKFGRCRVPMNIQFFADGDASGTGEGESGGAGGGAAGDTGGSENGGNQPKSFDDWLAANKEYQAEFDRRTQKALNTQKDKLEVLYSEKTTEAEKLAMMTKEEKAQYLAQKHEKELDEREAGITRRELMAEAKNTLAEKKLPVGLAEVLNYTDADSCNKSIAAVEKAFQEAVQAAVEEKLKGGKPPKAAPGSNETDLAKQVEKLMRGEV